MEDLKVILSQLHEESQALMQAALAYAGDEVERAAQAGDLEERLEALREHYELAAADRPELTVLWQAIERDLIFVQFAATEEQPEPADEQPEPANQVASEATAINQAAFALAKAVVRGEISQEDCQASVRELDQRIQGLVGKPGQESPEVQAALAEADLDLTYAYEGGKGAMSLRMAQFLQASE